MEIIAASGYALARALTLPRRT